MSKRLTDYSFNVANIFLRNNESLSFSTKGGVKYLLISLDQKQFPLFINILGRVLQRETFSYGLPSDPVHGILTVMVPSANIPRSIVS